MRKSILVACTVLAFFGSTPRVLALCGLQVQHPDDLLEAKFGRLGFDRLSKAPTPYQRADRPIDVLHYDLDLQVSLETVDLSGVVVATLMPLAPLDTVTFDFRSEISGSSGMVVDSVTVDGNPVLATHVDDELRIPLSITALPADTLTIEVAFSGRPLRDWILGYGLRNFFDRTDPQLPVLPDEPILQSLSEPDAARSWWPCHDHPFDAATVDLHVTAPTRFELAAPGVMTEDTDLGGGLRRQSWSMSRPIPSYLVSLNVADYVSWTDSVVVDHLVDPVTGQTETRTMPLQYFVPSFEEAAARYTWSKVGRMVQVFAEKFGPYPYADIKYGMSLFQFGGAMEHPTMSSMGQFTVSQKENPDVPGSPGGEWIAAHELCHQWFGDAVRVERWGEIWLNEGLARWSEALWFELEYGPEAGRVWLDRIYRDSYPGSIVDPGALFGTTVYNKGARVVHQLRQVVGDVAFFEALRQYMTDPAIRFGAVNSGDFQAHFEATYGQSLDWYFDPWLNWPGRPSLTLTQYRIAGGVHLEIEQPTDRIYRLPLPLRLVYEDGSFEDRLEWIGESGAVSAFDLLTDQPVTAVAIDPERDWLLDVEVAASYLTPRVELIAAYPNPFNPQLTLSYFAGQPTTLAVEVYDARGRRVRTLRLATVDPGIGTLVWDGSDSGGRPVVSGVYHLRFLAGDGTEERRSVTLLR